MKSFKYVSLAVVTAFLSLSVHAIPPAPPSPATQEPAIIQCKDANALTVEEIAKIDEDPDRIVSFDPEFREICYRVN